MRSTTALTIAFVPGELLLARAVNTPLVPYSTLSSDSGLLPDDSFLMVDGLTATGSGFDEFIASEAVIDVCCAAPENCRLPSGSKRYFIAA